VLFKSPHKQKLVVLSEDWGGHSTLLFALFYLLALQNAMNTGFTDTSLATALPHRLLRVCVKTLTLSQHFHCQLNCEVFQCSLSTLYTAPTAPYRSRKHVIVTRVGGDVPNSFLQRLCTSFTFFISSSFKEYTYIAQMLIVVLTICFTLASAN
jgi:hypothetical protein